MSRHRPADLGIPPWRPRFPANRVWMTPLWALSLSDVADIVRRPQRSGRPPGVGYFPERPVGQWPLESRAPRRATRFSTLVDTSVDNGGIAVGTPAADDLWAKVAAAVRAQLSEAAWNTWFQGVHALDLHDDTLILGVPSSVAVERLRTSYLGLLADAVQALHGYPLSVELIVDTAERAVCRPRD